MPQTSRELVQRCLRFATPERVPRDMWLLPWATIHYPEEVADLTARFPSDFARPGNVYLPSSRTKGDPHEIGLYTDDWGCVFTNYQRGCIGEVREPILTELERWNDVRPPYETLPVDTAGARGSIRRFWDSTDKYVLSICCPRPWERYQFLRGVQNAMMDVLEPDKGFRDLLRSIHEFYLTEMEFWVQTDVDGITFMDDWGSQRNLLISPSAWREFFRPIYRDYCDLAHAHGKAVFMHSDGHISAIYEDLIEIGVDAINSQLFCMDLGDLSQRAKGHITFWGEIDRQHTLPSDDPEVGRQAVRDVARHLYDPAGGIIAQFEFGLGANPHTAAAIFEEWDVISEIGLQMAN